MLFYYVKYYVDYYFKSILFGFYLDFIYYIIQMQYTELSSLFIILYKCNTLNSPTIKLSPMLGKLLLDRQRKTRVRSGNPRLRTKTRRLLSC